MRSGWRFVVRYGGLALFGLMGAGLLSRFLQLAEASDYLMLGLALAGLLMAASGWQSRYSRGRR